MQFRKVPRFGKDYNPVPRAFSFRNISDGASIKRSVVVNRSGVLKASTISLTSE
jgi:hypothetical protein